MSVHVSEGIYIIDKAKYSYLVIISWLHSEACKIYTKSYPRLEIAGKVKCSYSSQPWAGFSAIEMTGNLLKQSFRTNFTIKYYSRITIHAKSDSMFKIRGDLMMKILYSNLNLKSWYAQNWSEMKYNPELEFLEKKLPLVCSNFVQVPTASPLRPHKSRNISHFQQQRFFHQPHIL